MSTLNEEILRLKNAKAAIDEVLIARGVSIPENATLDTYNELINSIQGGTSSEEVTATKANVLAGTTTITADSNDEIVEGTMPNNSGQAKGTDNVYFDDSYMQVAIKYPGYYDENSTIRIGKSNLGNATADKVLEGTTYSSSEGLSLSGNIPIKSADTYFASTNDLTIDAGQYLGGTQTIKGLAQTNFSPANIKTGVTVKINNGDRDLFSATGTYTNDADATSANMLNGKTAYVKGEKVTGTIPTKSGTADMSSKIASWYNNNLLIQGPSGYHPSNNSNGYYDIQLTGTTAASQLGIAASKIIKGQSIGPISGTATSDATAATGDILTGKTAYVNGSKITGTVTVQSILSFSAAPYSDTQITFTWKNPAKGAFSGVIIVGKTGSYPTSVSDGTRYYKGSGNNTTANGTSTQVVSGFTQGTTYYFRAFAYAVKNNAEWVCSSSLTATATTKAKGMKTFTSSGTFTVPANVTKIDIFCVGGGGAGGAADDEFKQKEDEDVYGYYSGAAGGGGGGYTATKKGYAVTPGQTFAVTIGAGAPQSNVYESSSGTYIDYYDGSATSFGSVLTANGGETGGTAKFDAAGGSGGSGGGSIMSGWQNQRVDASTNGGSDGSSANLSGLSTTTPKALGQGTTTRAFGESNGTLYAGGGGARCAFGSSSAGAGGGGGTANTGGGSNGRIRRYNSGYTFTGSGGGSGICIVRWGY